MKNRTWHLKACCRNLQELEPGEMVISLDKQKRYCTNTKHKNATQDLYTFSLQIVSYYDYNNTIATIYIKEANKNKSEMLQKHLRLNHLCCYYLRLET